MMYPYHSSGSCWGEHQGHAHVHYSAHIEQDPVALRHVSECGDPSTETQPVSDPRYCASASIAYLDLAFCAYIRVKPCRPYDGVYSLRMDAFWISNEQAIPLQYQFAGTAMVVGRNRSGVDET